MSAPMATCPRDGTPLIATIVFPGAEFYCLECGAHLGFLEPRGVPDTPEVQARYQALCAEWDEHAAPRLRLIHGWFADCDKCNPWRSEHHDAHATDEERAAHEAALEWLRERRTA